MLKQFGYHLDAIPEQAFVFASTVTFVRDLDNALERSVNLRASDLVQKMIDHFTPAQNAPINAKLGVLSLVLGDEPVNIKDVSRAIENLKYWKTQYSPPRVSPNMLTATLADFKKHLARSTSKMPKT